MFKFTLKVLMLVTFAFAFAAVAQAQATRTWVSGVGDDANPCSRTAPCKTFAGAISKTATGGEINVLDPGGFGGVTITKSTEGFEAGVLVAGPNAVIINPTTTSDVVLRGLDFEGLGTGLVGIKVLGGLRSLHVEKCTINAFRGTNGSGIEVATSTAAATTQVYIKDTIVRGNGQGTGGGIFINPSGTAVVKASLSNVRMENNLTFGFKSQGTSTSNITDSVAAGNTAAGVHVNAANASLNVNHTLISNNGTGINCANATFRIGHSGVYGNTTAVTTAGALCFSFGNNTSDAVLVPPLQLGGET